MRIIGLALAIATLLTLGAARAANAETTPLQPSPADLETVKHMLTTADAAAKGPGSSGRQGVSAAVERIADASLRQKMHDLLPELAAIGVHHAWLSSEYRWGRNSKPSACVTL